MAIRPCGPADLERLIPLLDEEFVFCKGRTLSLRQRFPTVFCGENSHNILLCAQGEEIMSALAMRRFEWHMDGEIFRGAMIGSVYTRPARRGEGWASRLLNSAAEQLREEKLDFGVLWTGQQEFYARLGWIAADCGVLGVVDVLEPEQPETSSSVSTMPATVRPSLLEDVRHRWLNSYTLRRPEDYRQLPLPAERMDLLWCADDDKLAYALLGSSGTTGFLYELVGDAACFPALWQEACRGRQRVFINDQTDSPSYRWLTDHIKVSWKDQNLAMWLPLLERVCMQRLGKATIPYFDRI